MTIQAILSRVGALALTIIAAAGQPLIPAAPHSAQIPEAYDAATIVAKIGDRLASYPKLESWQALAHSTKSRMSSDWVPKSTTTSEKIVTLDGGGWNEEILSATETESGRTRDVTTKLQVEAREHAEKQRRSTGEGHNNESRSRSRRSPDRLREEAFPFSPEKRSGYDFSVLGPADLDGTPVILLRSRCRVRSGDNLEGLYYVRPDTYDVLRAELTMPKRPFPLRRMEMEVDFLVLPEGHQVMKKAVIRVHIGLIVKNIRVEDIETFSDHVVR
jgi:hypothetical protein